MKKTSHVEVFYFVLSKRQLLYFSMLFSQLRKQLIKVNQLSDTLTFLPLTLPMVKGDCLSPCFISTFVLT